MPERHGMTKTPEYRIWAHMKTRTTNPKDRSYAYYRAKGIEVCERWRKSFKDFYSDMGKRPSAKHSIDRINNNIGYKPGNCRWATPTLQTINKGIDLRNKSGVKGVYKHKATGRWHASIGLYGKRYSLGYFDDITEAIAARKRAEKQYFSGLLKAT